jgi:hypothetical protein
MKTLNIKQLENDLKAFEVTVISDPAHSVEDVTSLTFCTDYGFLRISKSYIKKGYQIDYISTKQGHRSKGYATNFYNLVKNLLKSQGFKLHHSNSKTVDGSKWVDSLKEG